MSAPALEVLRTKVDAVAGTSPELAPVAQPFPVVRVLDGAPPEPPAVHVSDLVIERDLNLWLGRGGVAKTVLLLVTSVCTVLGRPVFGSLAVKRPGPVLLVLPEDGQSAARMMLDAIIEGMGLGPSDRALLTDGLVMISDESLVNITTDARRIRQTAVDVGAVLTAFDPLRNLLGGAAENENDVAGQCCDVLRREVCRGANATVLLNHHNRKPSNQPGPEAAPTINDARGAGGWTDGSRLVFGITKKANRITMTGLKANRLRADLRHELELSIVADANNAARWISCQVTDANSGSTSESLTPGIGRSLNANEQSVLGCLKDDHEPDLRLSWSRWAAGSGLNENTFRSIKDRLIDAGLAQAIPTGRKNPNGSPSYAYAVTPKGRSALSSGWVNEHFNGEMVSNGESNGV